MALVPLSTQAVFDGPYPVEGAQLFAYDAGTTTPRVLYLTKDLDPTRVHPRPVQTSNGCFPVMFAGAGDYDLVVQDSAGAQIRRIEGLPGEAAASGGGGTLDPLRQLPTGAVLPIYGTGRRQGFVRANGLTIGSASSGGSERANDDCHDLFVFLYEQDASLAVSGGRSPTGAEADWEAGKTITLPNLINRTMVGAGDAYALGATGGAAKVALTAAQNGPHGHSASFSGTPVGDHVHPAATGAESQPHQHSFPVQSFTILQGSAASVQFFAIPSGTPGTPVDQATSQQNVTHTHGVNMEPRGGHTPSGTVSVDNSGDGQAHENMPPFVAVTAYLKL